jgi:Mn2+/Fe2+ NRAMP family transporter
VPAPELLPRLRGQHAQQPAAKLPLVGTGSRPGAATRERQLSGRLPTCSSGSRRRSEDNDRRTDTDELRGDRAHADERLHRIKLDTWVGMLFSNATALGIVIATAATLNLHGITNIETSAQAAEALRAVAGEFALALFALGNIASGLLAVPVLAGSAAYAVSELFGWKSGPSHDSHEARGFYPIIFAVTGIGTLMSIVELDPISTLVWSALVHGLVSASIMVVMM